MKYDCTKTLDYAHEARRMCKTHKYCEGCPLNTRGRGGCTISYIDTTRQDIIDIVQKWSDEHPEKTRKEAFLEMFPKANMDIQDKTPVNCYGALVGGKDTICRTYCSCVECWNKPYNGEFEKARENNA